MVGLVCFQQMPSRNPMTMKGAPRQLSTGPQFLFTKVLAELTQRKPFVDIVRLIIIGKKLSKDQVIVN